MLDQHGEFFPYCVALESSGEARMIAGDPGQGERPPSTEVLATLVQGLRRERELLRAVAVVSDVRTAVSDAVRVELEHSEGPAMAVLLPYKKKRLRKGVDYGALGASAAQPAVWT
jgi:hypothetical protein